MQTAAGERDGKRAHVTLVCDGNDACVQRNLSCILSVVARLTRLGPVQDGAAAGISRRYQHCVRRAWHCSRHRQAASLSLVPGLSSGTGFSVCSSPARWMISIPFPLCTVSFWSSFPPFELFWQFSTAFARGNGCPPGGLCLCVFDIIDFLSFLL